MSEKIQTIGIIGAGQMGSGIAHVSALAAAQAILLFDVAPRRIEKGIATINGNMARQVTGSCPTTTSARPRSRDTASAFDPCRASPPPTSSSRRRPRTVRQAQIFAQVSPMPRPGDLAASTSSSSITRLAAQTDRPGAHRHPFHEPVPVAEACRASSPRHRRGRRRPSGRQNSM